MLKEKIIMTTSFRFTLISQICSTFWRRSKQSQRCILARCVIISNITETGRAPPSPRSALPRGAIPHPLVESGPSIPNLPLLGRALRNHRPMCRHPSRPVSSGITVVDPLKFWAHITCSKTKSWRYCAARPPARPPARGRRNSVRHL